MLILLFILLLKTLAFFVDQFSLYNFIITQFFIAFLIILECHSITKHEM